MSDLNESIVYSELVEAHGTIEQQTDALILAILNAFQNPEVWPMTDAERILLLKQFYRKATTIKRTEIAKITSSKP